MQEPSAGDRNSEPPPLDMETATGTGGGGNDRWPRRIASGRRGDIPSMFLTERGMSRFPDPRARADFDINDLRAAMSLSPYGPPTERGAGQPRATTGPLPRWPATDRDETVAGTTARARPQYGQTGPPTSSDEPSSELGLSDDAGEAPVRAAERRLRRLSTDGPSRDGSSAAAERASSPRPSRMAKVHGEGAYIQGRQKVVFRVTDLM